MSTTAMEVTVMTKSSIRFERAAIARQSLALGLSILLSATLWSRAPRAEAQDELCGNGSIDFAAGETCDDGGICEGGENDGVRCTSLKRCVGGENQFDACETDGDCPNGTCPEPCPGGTCVPQDGDLDLEDTCPANCRINRSCTAPSCPADCNGDGIVDVSELVSTLNIGLGLAPIDQCAAADPDSNGVVTIDNAVSGVESAINGCPPSTMDVKVTFTAPGTGDLSTGRFFLRYPDSLLRIPGSGASEQVQERFDVPFVGSLTPNDIDYAVRVLAQAELFLTIEPDELFTVSFDLCSSTPPTAEDFRCTVVDAFAPDASDVTDETSCSVELQ